MRLRVPAAVRAKAVAAGAGDWLGQLPSLVAQLEQRWSLVVGQVYPAATEALVARVTLEDGIPAVLKIVVPRADDVVSREATVLRLAGGVGCVRLLRHDLGRGALLLERLGPSLYDLGLPIVRRHEILCATASRVWRPVPPGCDLPTGADQGRWLADFIGSAWRRLGQPCSERAVDHAQRCAGRRIAAHQEARAGLVHGDVHQWNALRSADGFKLVDPDGLIAEPEYDLGIIMREDPVELLETDPRERARWLAARTGCDPVAIWEWGVAERVSTGLVLTGIGVQPVGRQMLAAADRIAAAYPEPP